MYQIKKIFLLCLTGLIVVSLLSGCAKNLNQVPQSTASKAAIFGSVDGLQLYANSFYDGLPALSDSYKTDPGLCDFGAIGNVANLIRPGTLTSRQVGSWGWGTLRNLNYFIANCNNPAIPVATRNNYIGLARFFRAYFYYNMVQRFGNVPWIGQPLSVSDSALYAPRDPRTKVMDSVLADLNFACANITAKTDATATTITRWVAYGLKSRICLFEGTFRKYQDSLAQGLSGTASLWLQNAADAAKAVIDSGGFSLNQGGGPTQAYRQVFISPTVISSEVMLCNAASASLGVYNDANWWYTSATYGSRFSFIRKFINTYLNIDGTRFTDIPGHDTLTFMSETKNRDLRLAQTIRVPGYKRTSSGQVISAPPVFSYTYTGYQPIKWCMEDAQYDNSTSNINPVALMRYAEILLNYAEAKEELQLAGSGTFTAADWSKTIGALRARAGITGVGLAMPTSMDPYMKNNYYPDVTDAVLMEIRRERGIELCLEGLRLADLTRWKHGELLLDKWNGMYVPALNYPLDLDQDGKLDVCFYQTTPPSPSIAGVTYVNVAPTIAGGSVNPQILSNGTYGELHWLDNIQRYPKFYNYLYLNPLSYTDLTLNPNLTQNPGWQ